MLEIPPASLSMCERCKERLLAVCVSDDEAVAGRGSSATAQARAYGQHYDVCRVVNRAEKVNVYQMHRSGLFKSVMAIKRRKRHTTQQTKAQPDQTVCGE